MLYKQLLFSSFRLLQKLQCNIWDGCDQYYCFCYILYILLPNNVLPTFKNVLEKWFLHIDSTVPQSNWLFSKTNCNLTKAFHNADKNLLYTTKFPFCCTNQSEVISASMLCLAVLVKNAAFDIMFFGLFRLLYTHLYWDILHLSFITSCPWKYYKYWQVHSTIFVLLTCWAWT